MVQIKEIGMSRRSWLNTAVVILVVTAGAAQAEEKAARTKTPITGVDRSYMDLTVSPCKDFYAYANGAFEKVPIPGEYSAYGVNQEIDERNFAILKEILENSARAGGPKGSVVQRVGDFYASGMDEAAIDREGLRPLMPWLSRIQAIASHKELVAVIAQLQALGLNVGFHLGVEIDDKDTTKMIAGFTQGGLGLPERDYYFRRGKMPRTSAPPTWRTSPECSNWPATPPAAKATADSIMAFETKLAEASRTLVDLRDPEKNYNKFQRDALTKLAPGLDWDGYFASDAFQATKPSCSSASRSFSRPSAACSPPSRFRSGAITSLAPPVRNRQLSRQAFGGGAFRLLRQETLRRPELRPRWKRVLAAADVAIGEDLGQLYVQQAFSPAAKARAQTMVNSQGSHGERVRAAEWMSEATKAEAYRKLDTMRSKVGYPDKRRDYSKLDIARRPYVLNVLAADAFEFPANWPSSASPWTAASGK